MQGLSLIELVVAIVLLAILGVGFMVLYGQVTRRDAAGDQVAPMTWVGQGVMEAELAQTEWGQGPFALNQRFGPYQVVAQIVKTTSKRVSTGRYYAYLVTLTVTCVATSCPALTLSSYVYTT